MTEEDITEEEINTWLRSHIRDDSKADRYGAQQSASSKYKSRNPARNLPISHPFRALALYRYNGILLRPGVNVELQGRAFIREVHAAGYENEPHTSIIRIVDIIEDTISRAVTLRGWIFQRAQYLYGLLEKKRNEVCWVLHVDDDDTRDMKLQAMETVRVEDVIRRRKVILTNQPWPKLSFREDISCLLEDSDVVIRDERILVCRYKYICHYVSADRRDANSWSERELQRLRTADCDKWSGCEEPCATNDKGLRKAWRGETILGGAFVSYRGPDMQNHRPEFTAPVDVIDLTGEASKLGPDTTTTSPSTPRLDGIHPCTTCVDWPTNDAIRCYTINGLIPAKRRIETLDVTQSSKRHLGSDLGVDYAVPAKTVSMLDELRKKCSVAEIQPLKLSPMLGSEQKQSTTSTSCRRTLGSRSCSTKQQYTLGDAFCGAGGMSRAANQSGLHITYAFDSNKNACKSYKMNFPDVDVHCLWADVFVKLPNDCKVDIAHLSPPCQFFSDAHTKAGKDDELNTASLFAVGELLRKSRPRMVTLEQTFGIVLRARHQGYLNALIQVFTSHGFSIRWRLLQCADYGLPQMRLRTFMIASWRVSFLRKRRRS
ncbi:MAG: hypothetical protein Q9182_005704 [Xanthomendoza sp. 2 TL-2023]